MSPKHVRTASRRLTVAVAVVLVGLAVTAAAPASADVGFRDFSYGTTVTAPTGQKPQSKLWWTSGGQWGGVLWHLRHGRPQLQLIGSGFDI